MLIDARTQKQMDGAGKARGKVSYMACNAKQARQWAASNGGNAFGYAARYAHVTGITLDNVVLVVTGKGVYIAHVDIDSDGVIVQDTTQDVSLIHQFSFDKSGNVTGP